VIRLCAISSVLLFVGLLSLALATAQAGENVFVSVNAGGSELEISPSAIHLVSNENLNGIRWSSWGGRTASGRATDYANGPNPGHSGRNPVRVRLERRRRCRGLLVYTSVRLRFTKGVPYTGQSHVTRYPFGCPL